MKPCLNRMLTIFCLFLCSTRVYAVDIGYKCTNHVLSITGTLHVDVGRDAQVGEVIGPWMNMINPSRHFNCARALSGTIPSNRWFPSWARGRLKLIGGYGVTGVWGTITHEGDTYRVYRVGNVGFIMRWVFQAFNHHSTSQSASFAVTANPGSVQQDEIFYNFNTGSPGSLPASISFRNEVKVRMVKIHPDYPQANSSVNFYAAELGLHTGELHGAPLSSNYGDMPGGSFNWYTTNGERQVHVTVKFGRVNAACETPDVQVALGQITVANLKSFNAPSTSAEVTPFTIQFKQCPKYLSARPVVKFEPVASAQYSQHGMLSLISPSTATGVGVQILRGVGTGQYINFSVYRTSFNGNSGTINDTGFMPTDPALPYDGQKTLFARMVRLPGQTPTAGTVRAQMKVLVTYK